MVRYRFKTKEEFLKDFGKDWRQDVRMCWPAGMDRYLGQEIAPEHNHRCEESRPFFIGEYQFVCDMYVKKEPEFVKGIKIQKNGLFNKK